MKFLLQAVSKGKSRKSLILTMSYTDYKGELFSKCTPFCIFSSLSRVDLRKDVTQFWPFWDFGIKNSLQPKYFWDHRVNSITTHTTDVEQNKLKIPLFFIVFCFCFSYVILLVNPRYLIKIKVIFCTIFKHKLCSFPLHF